MKKKMLLCVLALFLSGCSYACTFPPPGPPQPVTCCVQIMHYRYTFCWRR